MATGVSASLVVGDQATPVVIEDMSLGGFKARLGGPINLPPRASGILRIESADKPGEALETPFINPGARAKSEGRSVGLKFYGLNGDRFVIVAKAMFSDTGPIYQRRSGRVVRLGVLSGSLHLVIWALNQTMRGLYYFAFRRGETASAPRSR